jgi:hypothetical protein
MLIHKLFLFFCLISIVDSSLLGNDSQPNFIIAESDSIYYQGISDIRYSPDNNYYVINPKGRSNRINIYNKDNTLYKSYLVDDSYSFRFLDSIYYDPSERLISREQYLSLPGSTSRSEFGNTISESSFLNDSTIVTISALRYLVYEDPKVSSNFDKLNVLSVILMTNIFTDEVTVKPLRYNNSKLHPQSEFIDIIGNDFYFELFPTNFYDGIPNSEEYTVGKINIEDYDWKPAVKLPQEYIDSKIGLEIGNNFSISEIDGKPYFLALLSNYVFNLDNDTIRFSDLPEPIEYSLNKFQTETIDLPEEMYKLDSLSHMNLDFFFRDQYIYLMLNKPKTEYGKTILNKSYLNKYTLNGALVSSVHINKDIDVKSLFYAANRGIMAISMIDQKWHVYEIPIN